MNDKTAALSLDRLVRLLETDRTLPDFPAACRRLHLLPGPLNETLLRELGLGGEEFLTYWM